jgi:hypothetical protein
VHTHPATLATDKLLDDCDVRRSRGSGPGGQHRNKVETAIEIMHRPTGASGAASERRTQTLNRRVAVFRLRVNLALQHRMSINRTLRPPERFRLPVNPKHDDFPAVLAIALDAVAGFDGEVKSAATWLQCSTSQLVKLLRAEPRALRQVNDDRGKRGLKPLR